LNERAGTRFKPTSEASRRLIAARLDEGYTADDMREVIDRQCRQWLGTDMARYLRPETLFNRTKFEGYHGGVEAPPKANPFVESYMREVASGVVEA
jgi:uncharacterized phage protein (TIGR02220 family)